MVLICSNLESYRRAKNKYSFVLCIFADFCLPHTVGKAKRYLSPLPLFAKWCPIRITYLDQLTKNLKIMLQAGQQAHFPMKCSTLFYLRTCLPESIFGIVKRLNICLWYRFHDPHENITIFIHCDQHPRKFSYMNSMTFGLNKVFIFSLKWIKRKLHKLCTYL